MQKLFAATVCFFLFFAVAQLKDIQAQTLPSASIQTPKTHGKACDAAVVHGLCNSDDFSCIVNQKKLVKKEDTITKHISSITISRENIVNLAVTPSQNTEISPTAIVPTQTEQFSLNPDTILALINQIRQEYGLVPFQKDESLCQVAESRKPELPGEIATGRLHSGLYSRDLPYWVTENMKYGGDEQETVRWWMNSPIHRSAIMGEHTYSCGACTGDTCVELFTSFVPK